MPPTMHRPAFHVWIAPPDADHDTIPEDQLTYAHVRVSAGDQLRAELEARKLNLGSAKDTPMHLTVMWLWAAMVRGGSFDGPFAAFRERCVSFDPDRPADELEGDPAGEVIPTVASTS